MSRAKGPIALLVVLATAGAAGLLLRPARIGNADLADYACVRSILFDHDVRLQNDDRLLGVDTAVLEAAGRHPATCAAAKAVLWSPFVGAGDLAARLFHRTSAETTIDGTSTPYRQAVRLAGLFYGVVGLWCCYLIARTRFSTRLSAVSIAAVTGGSFLLWYLLVEPAATVPLALALAAAFSAGWLRLAERPGSRWSWLLLGLAGGLLVALRWQHVAMLMLPVASLVTDWRRAGARIGRRHVLVCALVFAVGVAGGVLPQAALSLAGGPGISAAASAIVHTVVASPHIVDHLWSTPNGVLAASPALYAAAIGLVLLWRHDPRLSAAGLFLFAAAGWTAGPEAADGRYGMGAFAAVVPFFVCGMAAFVVALAQALARRPAAAAAGLAGMLVLWNFTLIGAARTGVFGIGEPVSFGTVGAAQARLLHDWVGHPLAYPANLVFAMQNRVGPAAFDLLYANRLLRDPTQSGGRIDLGGATDRPYAESGWYEPEHDGSLSFRWTRATAVLLVPLDHPADLTLRLTLEPFSYPGAPPQRLTVAVNGTTLEPRYLAPGWQSVELSAPAGLWRAGVNRVRLECSRETRPSDVGAADTRPLAAAVDDVELERPGIDAQLRGASRKSIPFRPARRRRLAIQASIAR